MQKNKSKLLLDSNPLIIIPELAVLIGLNESIILQQIHYWLQKSTHFYDGRAWVYNSIPQWCEQFPFLSQRSIERALASLKNLRLILTANYNKLKQDRTLWYAIDYDELESLQERSSSPHKTPSRQNGGMVPPRGEEPSNPHENPSRQNGGMVLTNCQHDHDNLMRPLPEITSEIIPEKKDQSVSLSVCNMRNQETRNDEETGRQADIFIDETMIKKQVGYSALIQRHSQDLVNEIMLNILDMYYSNSIKIKGEMKPQVIVHSILSKLNHWHIQYVLDRFKQVGRTIINKKDYLQSMIYNSVLEQQAHYENEYRTDIATYAGTEEREDLYADGVEDNAQEEDRDLTKRTDEAIRDVAVCREVELPVCEQYSNPFVDAHQQDRTYSVFTPLPAGRPESYTEHEQDADVKFYVQGKRH